MVYTALNQDLNSGCPKMYYRACSSEQFMRQHIVIKNKIMFFISGHPQDVWTPIKQNVLR